MRYVARVWTRPKSLKRHGGRKINGKLSRAARGTGSWDFNWLETLQWACQCQSKTYPETYMRNIMIEALQNRVHTYPFFVHCCVCKRIQIFFVHTNSVIVNVDRLIKYWACANYMTSRPPFTNINRRFLRFSSTIAVDSTGTTWTLLHPG